MTTQEFIAAEFGCTKAESDFIDNLTDEKFPSFGDWWSNDVFDDFNPKICRICDYLIQKLFYEVIEHYKELGLDEDKFDIDINSICSRLTYDGESVYEEDLENIVEQLNDEEDD